MKPAAFKYALPRTLDEALALKAEHGDDATFLAGGQSLIPAMNFRLAQPEVLIDLNALDELAFIRTDEESGDLHLGGLTRHRDLQFDPVIAAAQPLLHETVPNVAHPQIRNRGTLCGNLAHADPASEFPAVMLALKARLRLQSTAGERWLPAEEFFVSVFTTARDDDEMLVEVAGRWCNYRMFFFWQDEISAMQFYCQYDMKVPAGRAAAVHELLATINERMWLGHFDIDTEEQIPMFRHTTLLRGAQGASVEQLEDLVDIALTECERFYPAFQFVIWGGKSAPEAVSAAILDTVAEA